MEPIDSTIIFYDNESSIKLCKRLKLNYKVRHINTRISYIRECINAKLIKIRFICSEDNMDDVLTKPLPYESFKRQTDKLINDFNGDFNYLLEQPVSLHSVMLSLEQYDKVLLSLS